MKCQGDGCSNPVEQSPIGRPRKFCSRTCSNAYHNARKPKKGRVRHTVTELDDEARTGVCAVCGPVKVLRTVDKYQDGRPRVRWICSKRHRKSSAESRKRFQASEKGRLLNFKTRYGLTREQAQAALAKRGEGCDICGRNDRRLVYDHCHSAGTHRGWLCDGCNTGLGNFEDDSERLRAAINYLDANVSCAHG